SASLIAAISSSTYSVFTKGRIFVNRHSSFFTEGNPSLTNSCMAALRYADHPFWLLNSRLSNSAAIASVSGDSNCFIEVIILISLILVYVPNTNEKALQKRLVFGKPVISLLFQFEGQLFPSGFNDFAVG